MSVGEDMFITTSRRPGHTTRILCREFSRFISNSKYVPRGGKTIERLASIARELGHDRVMLVGEISGEPRELRFLEVGEGWRWANAKVDLEGVDLGSEKKARDKIVSTNLYAEDDRAIEFAEWFGKLMGIERLDELPSSGGVIMLTSDDGIKLKFLIMPNSRSAGPVVKVKSFGRLYEG